MKINELQTNILKLYFRKWKIQDQLLLLAQSGLRIESIQDRWRRFMLIILWRLIAQLPILIECVKISNTKMVGTSSIGVSITSPSCQIFPISRIFTPSGLIVPVYSTNSNINPYSSITCQNVSLSHVKMSYCQNVRTTWQNVSIWIRDLYKQKIILQNNPCIYNTRSI